MSIRVSGEGRRLIETAGTSDAARTAVPLEKVETPENVQAPEKAETPERGRTPEQTKARAEADRAGREPGESDPAVALPAERRTRRHLAPGRPIPYGWALGPVLLLIIWSAGSAVGLIDPHVLSAPWTVVTTTGDLIADGRLQTGLWTSARRALIGLGFGIAVGLVLAVISGLSRLGEALIDGPVKIKLAISTLALLPLLLLWFGIGESMKIITIALAAFVYIYVHTHNGLRNIDSRYVELAETVRLRRPQFLWHVVLPGALPSFLLGLRFAITHALLTLVVVEQVNATSGIGYMMGLARTYGQTDIIIVGLVVYGIFGLVSDGLVRLVERRALSWRRTLAD